LSEEEFLNLPEAPGKQELLDGELIVQPAPKYTHHELTDRLRDLLRTALDRSRVWTEMPYHLRMGRWLTPDVSVSWPDQTIVDDWLQGSPMVAVEIASGGNTPEQLEAKTAAYLEHGAAEVWVIYPKTRSMLISRQGGSVLRVDGTGDYRCDLIGVTVRPEERTAAG
jgi:Uma2 family endonuclease